MKLTGTDLFLLADGRRYKVALKYQPYGHSLKKKHSSSNWLGPWRQTLVNQSLPL